MKRAIGLLGLLLMAVGCESNYTSLRFRPVDTTRQHTVEGVHVVVNGVERGVTDNHGQVDISGLQAGDKVVFAKPGYESTSLLLGWSSFRQRSPISAPDDVLFDLRDLDAVPIPLHRSGAVRNASTGQ